MNAAIIVAAGSSRRMGFQKLTADLLGHPVLLWTLKAFDECPAVDVLVVVVNDITRELVETWIRDGVFKKPVTLSEGGAERHLSVQGGIQVLPDGVSHVAVHDGARPLITREQIIRCFEYAFAHDAVACARRVTETLKLVNDQGVIVNSLDREGVWVMETPQVFERQLLTEAYECVSHLHSLVTDEVSAVQLLNREVFVVENAENNLKITYPADLLLAEKLLMLRQEVDLSDQML